MSLLNTLKTTRHTIALSFKADSKITMLVGIMVLLQAAVVPLIALSQRWVIDAANMADMDKLTLAIIIGASAYAMQLIGFRVSHNYKNDLSNRIHLAIEQEVAELTSKIPSIEHLENSDYINRVTSLKRGTLALANTGWSVVQSCSSVISVGLSVWLLADIDPLFTLLALSGFLILPLANRAKRIRRAALESNVETLRKEAFLHGIYLDPVMSKEMWISGNGQQLSNTADKLWLTALSVEMKAVLCGLFNELAGWFMFYGIFAVILVKTAMDFSSGQFSQGDVILLISLTGQLQNQLGNSVAAMTQVADGGHVTSHYRWLQAFAQATINKGRVIPEKRKAGIELQNVSFQYPNSDRVVLKDVSLTIPWGRSIGIVGINGAGKTTLVKLLTGLLQPTSGDILIDGEKLSELDLSAWHSRCTGTFQDFVQLHASLRESVGVGDLNKMENEENIINALNMARADEFLDVLPQGLDTQLGGTFNGIELSRGQWQRLAIARGLMRDQALLAILDEPTAALDPVAEQKVFDLFAEQTSFFKNNSGIIALVSHRFSTVNMADTIVVLDNGHIVETGSHQDLMKKKGEYAALYKTQADAYGNHSAAPY